MSATGIPTFGFGATDSVPAVPTFGDYYDFGFGDVPPDGWTGDLLDLGFGDVPVPQQALVAYLLPVQTDDHLYPDDGGEIMELAADWKQAAGVGPYRVRLLDSNGTAWPPVADADGCYSARQGKGTACETNAAKSKLLFAMPRVPPGVYDIEVAWGPGYGILFVIEKALRAIYRGRSLQVYSLRRTFPGTITTGARTPSLDRKLALDGSG